ncbi:cytochrome c oxidase subunit II [Novosphingobium profundi]|uniref:cytochrome c oxidase subunit II n=1 Tax=Novosphingobium profundi TaxID=1774954 RepID=UPI001BDAB36B|nr:cytochrome c oxidase subunit II [Novosphingobium profundi]MBT0667615.1 cytochrome c oxidase subunit II [Novosphingobium profundi]
MMPEASTLAPRIDHLFFALVGLSLVIVLLVGCLVAGFAVRYRRGSKAQRGQLPKWITRDVELGWTAATFFVAIFIFWFAASMQTSEFEIPNNAMEIHVVAKQWMWKLEHADGQREINTLHVPVGVPVRLVMTSQDAIHSFFVPAFRIKQDVLPGRYTETWFQATKPGTYHLFCAEYCGTDHSQMTGGIVVMPPAAFARWSEGAAAQGTLAAQGAVLFRQLGCSGCHGKSARVRAPSLAGLYGTRQPMAGGGFRQVDEEYLHDSIEQPQKDIVAGYTPVMPSYQGIASEGDIIRIIAYLKTLKAGGRQ